MSNIIDLKTILILAAKVPGLFTWLGNKNDTELSKLGMSSNIPLNDPILRAVDILVMISTSRLSFTSFIEKWKESDCPQSVISALESIPKDIVLQEVELDFSLTRLNLRHSAFDLIVNDEIVRLLSSVEGFLSLFGRNYAIIFVAENIYEFQDWEYYNRINQTYDDLEKGRLSLKNIAEKKVLTVRLLLFIIHAMNPPSNLFDTIMDKIYDIDSKESSDMSTADECAKKLRFYIKRGNVYMTDHPSIIQDMRCVKGLDHLINNNFNRLKLDPRTKDLLYGHNTKTNPGETLDFLLNRIDRIKTMTMLEFSEIVRRLAIMRRSSDVVQSNNDACVKKLKAYVRWGNTLVTEGDILFSISYIDGLANLICKNVHRLKVDPRMKNILGHRFDIEANPNNPDDTLCAILLAIRESVRKTEINDFINILTNLADPMDLNHSNNNTDNIDGCIDLMRDWIRKGRFFMTEEPSMKDLTGFTGLANLVYRNVERIKSDPRIKKILEHRYDLGSIPNTPGDTLAIVLLAIQDSVHNIKIADFIDIIQDISNQEKTVPHTRLEPRTIPAILIRSNIAFYLGSIPTSLGDIKSMRPYYTETSRGAAIINSMGRMNMTLDEFTNRLQNEPSIRDYLDGFKELMYSMEIIDWDKFNRTEEREVDNTLHLLPNDIQSIMNRHIDDSILSHLSKSHVLCAYIGSEVPMLCAFNVMFSLFDSDRTKNIEYTYIDTPEVMGENVLGEIAIHKKATLKDLYFALRLCSKGLGATSELIHAIKTYNLPKKTIEIDPQLISSLRCWDVFFKDWSDHGVKSLKNLSNELANMPAFALFVGDHYRAWIDIPLFSFLKQYSANLSQMESFKRGKWMIEKMCNCMTPVNIDNVKNAIYTILHPNSNSILAKDASLSSTV
jgi:hypothetical protein